MKPRSQPGANSTGTPFPTATWLKNLSAAHLCTDEAALKVGVDGARSLRRLGVLPDLPAAHLREERMHREERNDNAGHGRGGGKSVLACVDR